MTERDLHMNDKYARHLSGMVRFPTVSSPDTSLTDYSVFDKFREYLEDAYPLVHKTLERTKIARASLLYRWKSEAPKKKPILLMTHQDAVPAGDPGNWKYLLFPERSLKASYGDVVRLTARAS